MSSDRNALASVIVAVNPHDYDFSKVLDAWASQEQAGRYEVVVVHDGSRPGIVEALGVHKGRHPFSPVRYVCADVRGRGALNNAGVRASRGDLLVFSADDSRPSPGMLAAHRAFHDRLERPGVGVGPIWFLRSLRDTPFRRWLEDSGENYGVPLSQGAIAWPREFFFVGNTSMLREVWARAGGFDERFPFDMHEDFLFGQSLLALGYQFTHLPRARALHDHPVDFEERKEAMRRLGSTSTLLAAKYAVHARVQVRTAADLEGLRQRDRAAEAATAGSRSIADWRRRWLAGFDLAYAEGVLDARADATVTPRLRAG